MIFKTRFMLCFVYVLVPIIRCIPENLSLWFSYYCIAADLSGRVVNSVTDSSIEDVKVFLASPACSTFSSVDGKFVLKIPTTEAVYFKPQNIQGREVENIFDLHGRMILCNKNNFDFSVGVCAARGFKFLNLRDGRVFPARAGGYTVGELRKSKAAFQIDFSRDGYKPFHVTVSKSGDIGEVQLSPENVNAVVQVSVELGQTGSIDVPVGLSAPDTGVKIVIIGQ